MRWGWLLIAFFYLLSFVGCSSLSRRRKKGYDYSGQSDYEQIKSQRVKEYKEELEQLRGKEPSQRY